MIFSEDRLEKTKSGLKIVTRRLALPDPDGAGDFECEMICYPNGVKAVQRYTPPGAWKTRWRVGQTLAMQPGRGRKAEGYIRITDLTLDENVTDISEQEVIEEGFVSRDEFLKTWVLMHDSDFIPSPITDWYQYARRVAMFLPERYRAWAIRYEYIGETK